MHEELHERAKEIFLAARKKKPDHRTEFVARASGGDESLRREVEDLLKYDTSTKTIRNATITKTSGPVPQDLLDRAVRRLRLVGLLLPAVLLATWLIPVTITGNLLAEFGRPLQWPFPVMVIIASLMIVWMTRTGLPAHRKLTFGLIYQVVVSYGLVSSQFWGTFSGYPAAFIQPDVVGYTGVALWMVLYSVVVPTSPKRALPALFASATAPPLTYLLTVRFDRAPALELGQFMFTLVVPYLASVAFSYIAAQIIYGLGREVSAAREMGSYRLVERLGEGGMGEVWRATHRLLARPAAIKLIRREAIAHDSAAIETAVRRFEREAQVTASLRSTHTVELYDFGAAEDGSLYYVMELLDGIDLDQLVRTFGPIEPARVLRLVQQACLSLAEAHERGLIHRDIKPANLFVCRLGVEYDVLKVLDFGLVRPVHRNANTSIQGQVAGTPAFMAPELASGSGEVDKRADIYALGCVMYWMLTGRNVFEAPSVVEMLGAHIQQHPEPPSQHVRDVPASIDDLVLQCLAKDPADRFATTIELRCALEQIQRDLPWSPEDAETWWSTHDVVQTPQPIQSQTTSQ